MIEVNDIFGLSGPLKKLIHVIGQGIGSITKPYLIKRTADAKAYEIKVIAEAIKENQNELKNIGYNDKSIKMISLTNETFNRELSVEQRSQSRLEYQEAQRQQNIESITQQAAKEISQESEVSEEPVDDDWTSRFFEYAKDISNKEMQELWAKILAGEVKRPKSFSLRTLELLRNLTKQEAEIFSKAANLRISSWDKPFIFKSKNENFLTTFDFTFEDQLLLVELGILQPESNITRRLVANPIDLTTVFESGKYLIRTVKAANSPEIRIPIFRFSKIGEELLSIVVSSAPPNYVNEFCRYLKSHNLEIEYSYLLGISNGEYKHTLPWVKYENSIT